MNRDLAYLSRRISRDMYKVLRIDLLADRYEVLVIRDDEDIFLADGEPVFSALVQHCADTGIIHPDECKEYLRQLNHDRLVEVFRDNTASEALWYRRRVKDQYRWCSVRLVPAEDFTPDNPQLLLYVTDDDSLDNLDLNAVQQQQLRYLTALTSIYMTMHMINLKDDSGIMIGASIPGEDASTVRRLDHVSHMFEHVIVRNVVPQHTALAKDFVNFATLPERMKGVSLITAEFLGKTTGWFRAQFIAVSHDVAGMVTDVIFTTQIIDKEKRREEALVAMTYTDALTRLYNRHAYEQALAALRDAPLPHDLVLIAMDLNRLKTTNDEKGHAAGDELLCGAAECMKQYFAPFGEVYRIGGDEFTAILHTDTDNLKQLLDNFAQAAAQWHGNTVQGLSISTGAVAVANEAELTGIDDLVHRADQEMYLSKACFYSFRGNDRRKPRKKYE